MVIEYYVDGNKIENPISDGQIVLDEVLNEVEGDITFNVPSLEMEDIDLRELDFKVICKDGTYTEKPFIGFREGVLQVFEDSLVREYEVDSLFITIIEKEIEYCMDCQGNTIIMDEPCLTCGGDGTLW